MTAPVDRYNRARERRRYDNGRREDNPARNWYKLKRWLDLRRTQLTLNPLCAMCQRDGLITAATIADHKIPHNGDPALFWNGELQSLCKPHHDNDKQREERGRPVQRLDPEGWPV